MSDYTAGKTSWTWVDDRCASVTGIYQDPFTMTADVYGADARAMVDVAADLLADGYTVTMHAFSEPVVVLRITPAEFTKIRSEDA